MKVVLSRKGFDSGAGGVPSPILPDGKMLSLPIPDKNSPIRYEDLTWNGFNVGEMVLSLSRGKVPPHYKAHLDPDLNCETLPRHEKWKPILGQVGTAQGHLRNQGVGTGDLFLFFGLFRKVTINASGLEFVADSSPKHVIWGWLQVDEVVPVDACDKFELEWANCHPHFHRPADKTNTVYIAKEHLDIPRAESRSLAGAGVFQRFSSQLQLTAPFSERPTLWQLPSWLYPSEGKTPLTYHSDLKRWQKKNGHTILNSANRGQEFVLDCANYPESIGWVSASLRPCNTLQIVPTETPR